MQQYGTALQAPPRAPMASHRIPAAPVASPKPQGRVRQLVMQELIALVVLPWLVFVLNCYLFAVAYHRTPKIVMGLIMVAMATCGFYCSKGVSRPDHPFRLYLSSACLLAISVATPVGLFAYGNYFSEYWFCADSHSYVNILPSEAALGYRDAGMVLFADEARVDASRSLGYKDGQVYCVAPILDDSDNSKNVQFWAAGVNCCGNRGSFSCDDAWDAQAHAGVVLSPQRRDWQPQYENAVRQAEAAFGVISAKNPVFVRWVVDPSKVQMNFWRIGNGILLGASVIYLVAQTAGAWLFNGS